MAMLYISTVPKQVVLVPSRLSVMNASDVSSLSPRIFEYRHICRFRSPPHKIFTRAGIVGYGAQLDVLINCQNSGRHANEREKKMRLGKIRTKADDSEDFGQDATDEGKDKNQDTDEERSIEPENIDWRTWRNWMVKGESNNSEADISQEKRWAHPLMKLENGCLLIAHPTAFQWTYLEKAVIFLFLHDEDGNIGLLLSKVLSKAMGLELGMSKVNPEFVNSHLYLGGTGDQVRVIHRVPGLPGSKEIIPGIYTDTTLAIMKESIRSGKSDFNDYQWFVGHIYWRKGRLEREIAEGRWYLAASSNDVLTNQAVIEKGLLWKEVLQLMGGKYSVIAESTDDDI